MNAKPDNLLLHRNYREKAPAGSGGGYNSWMGPGGSGTARANPAAAAAAATDASLWARGLNTKEQYEWFSNCYQMRCDDDYVWGGCNLHGPYDPDATPESIANDFLVYCILAQRAKAVPAGWDWKGFLKAAAQHIPFAFEKSDAKERWGSENYFEASMGGRSLRFTGNMIYKSDVNKPGDSVEQQRALVDADTQPAVMKEMLGGEGTWNVIVRDLRMHSRFSR